jgi:hypothetical protein
MPRAARRIVEPGKKAVSRVARNIRLPQDAASYCDCSTCSCGSCSCNCYCSACGSCYCDCSCSGGSSDMSAEHRNLARAVDLLNVRIGDVHRIVKSLAQQRSGQKP